MTVSNFFLFLFQSDKEIIINICLDLAHFFPCKYFGFTAEVFFTQFYMVYKVFGWTCVVNFFT